MGDLLTSYGVLIFLAAVLIFTGLFTVRQQTAYIIERFGKFHSIRQAGLQFKIPFLDKVSGKLNLKIQQLDVYGNRKKINIGL